MTCERQDVEREGPQSRSLRDGRGSQGAGRVTTRESGHRAGGTALVTGVSRVPPSIRQGVQAVLSQRGRGVGWWSQGVFLFSRALGVLRRASGNLLGALRRPLTVSEGVSKQPEGASDRGR